MSATPQAAGDAMDPTVFAKYGQEIPPQMAVEVLQQILPILTPTQLQYVGALMHTPEEFNSKFPEFAPQPPASSGMMPPGAPAGTPAGAAPAGQPAAAAPAAPAAPPMSAPSKAALAKPI